MNYTIEHLKDIVSMFTGQDPGCRESAGKLAVIFRQNWNAKIIPACIVRMLSDYFQGIISEEDMNLPAASGLDLTEVNAAITELNSVGEALMNSEDHVASLSFEDFEVPGGAMVKELCVRFPEDASVSDLAYSTGIKYDQVTGSLSVFDSDHLSFFKSFAMAKGSWLLTSSDFANAIMKSVGLNYFFSNICQLVSSNTTIVVDQFVSLINSFSSNNYGTIPSSVIQNIIEAFSTGGASAVIQWIYDYVFSAKKGVENNSIFNDTSVTLVQFVPGVLLASISGVLDVAALALVGISRVASAITAVISIGIKVGIAIYQKINSAERHFSFSNGDDCFSFVVSQTTVDNASQSAYAGVQSILQLISECGVFAISLSSIRSASVFYCGYDPESDTLEIEEHLSVNYDLTNCIRTYNAGYDIVLSSNPNNPTADNAVHVHLFPCNGFKNISLGSRPIFGVFKDRANQPLRNDRLDFEGVGSIAEQSFSPLSINAIDRFINTYTGEYDATMYIRLASALALWGLSHLTYNFEFDQHLGDAIDDLNVFRLNDVCCCFSFLNALNSGAKIVPAVQLALAGAFSFLLYTRFTEIDYNRWSDSESYDLTNNWQDTLITLVPTLFDGIPYNDPDYHADPYIAYARTYLVDTQAGVETLDQASDWLHFNWLSWYPFSYFDLSNFTVVTGMPSEFMVDIPNTTWSAVLLGLVVDGILAALAIATTVFAIIGFFKLKTLRTKYQYDADTAAFAYGETTTVDQFGNTVQKTAAQRATDWKNYNLARWKYNGLALLTGGSFYSVDGLGSGIDTTLSKFESLVSPITPLSSDETPTITLDDLYRAITGHSFY